MASPHVAGLGAYIMGLKGKMGGEALCTYIKNTALSGVISGFPSSTTNKFVFNGNPNAS